MTPAKRIAITFTFLVIAYALFDYFVLHGEGSSPKQEPAAQAGGRP